PETGLLYHIGFLQGHGVHIQRWCLVASIKHVDSLGCALHNSKTIKRRKYQVPQPNRLWHLDGHHKLILWGIVIHGMVDGY
ncbi:hypothetical protein M422DRAFT_141250, partial [Sphaerobolus stellatus SS14]